MLAEIFVGMIVGHLVADYLLQPKHMALHKTDRTHTGDLWCFLHCVIYTFSVAIFIWNFNPLILFLIFLSHYPIDRLSLAYWWLRLIGGRDILAEFRSTQSENPYREIHIPFACIVYTATDAAMHLVLLWLIAKFFI